MIGGGSKLPAILSAAKKRNSLFYINLVISHKSNSPGIKYAITNKIPAVYMNLVDYRNRYNKNKQEARKQYMKYLGWFISQKQYQPKLLVFAGWDLIMDKNFFTYFKCKFGNGYAAINLHPAILPKEKEGNNIKMPDGKLTPVIKGEQAEVLETVMAKKLSYFGPTVHFMVADKYDTGKIIEREFIKVGSSKNINDLRKKLMPVEDKILISSINKVCKMLI